MGFLDRFKRAPEPETLTIKLHKDVKDRWRVSVVDGDGKTLLVRSGFGFERWIDAREYAGRIAAARLEIQTEREND